MRDAGGLQPDTGLLHRVAVADSVNREGHRGYACPIAACRINPLFPIINSPHVRQKIRPGRSSESYAIDPAGRNGTGKIPWVRHLSAQIAALPPPDPGA
jgi:hypothetical protein